VVLDTMARAEEVVEVRTFAWEQTNLQYVTQWELHWGDVAGGPYVQLSPIGYPGGEGPTFSSPITATVTGPGGTTVTKYFKLRTCGDVPESDGSTTYKCSTFSGEVSSDFWIPVGEFQVPVEFRIIAQ